MGSPEEKQVCMSKSKFNEIRSLIGAPACGYSAPSTESASADKHNVDAPTPATPARATLKAPSYANDRGLFDPSNPLVIPGYTFNAGNCIAADSSNTQRARATRVGANKSQKNSIDIRGIAAICDKNPDCTGFDVDISTMDKTKVMKGWIHELPNMTGDNDNENAVCYTRDYAPKHFKATNGHCVARNPDDPAIGYIRVGLTLDEAADVCEKDASCIAYDYNPDNEMNETFFIKKPTDVAVKPNEAKCDKERKCYIKNAILSSKLTGTTGADGDRENERKALPSINTAVATTDSKMSEPLVDSSDTAVAADPPAGAVGVVVQPSNAGPAVAESGMQPPANATSDASVPGRDDKLTEQAASKNRPSLADIKLGHNPAVGSMLATASTLAALNSPPSVASRYDSDNPAASTPAMARGTAKKKYCGMKHFTPEETATSTSQKYEDSSEDKCTQKCMSEACKAWSFDSVSNTCTIWKTWDHLKSTPIGTTGGLCYTVVEDATLTGYKNVSISNAKWTTDALLDPTNVGEWTADEVECSKKCSITNGCRSFAFDPACAHGGEPEEYKKGVCRLFSKAFADDTIDLFRFDNPDNKYKMISADQA